MLSRPIILIGLPAVGKTTLANAVKSLRPEIEVADLDHLIAKSQGLSPAMIITRQGEAAFRAIESEALASISLNPNSILATGAGVVETAANLPLLKALGRVILLTAPHEVLLSRIALQKGMRPLAETNSDRKEWLRALDSHRSPIYRSLAEAEFDSSRLESEEQIRHSASLFIDKFLS